MSIEVKNICKNYGKQAALQQVSFAIKEGEVVGLLGANGAGKSTIMKILAGFLPPTSGEAFVNQLSVTQNSIATRRLVGYLPEHNPLYLDMYISEYLRFVANVYGLKKGEAAQSVQHVMEITGLMPERSKKIGQLSKGYRQRVGLAQALVHRPQVLILDEPTSGLDPHQLVEIRQLIAEVGKEKTVILSTHIMQEVEAVCNRVIIINKGLAIADDTPQNVRQQALMAHLAPVEVELMERIAPAQWQTDFIAQAEQTSDTVFVLYAKENEDIRAKIFNFAVQNGWTLLSMQQKQKPLEDVFRELTNH